MTRLRYFSSETLETLRQTVSDRLDWYYSPKGAFPSMPFSGTRESRLPDPALAKKLVTKDRQPYKTDVENALRVYEALSTLTPHQASIERVWTYLCHCDCPQYIANRWLTQRPDKEEDAVRKVRNHFFARGNRALIRDNGVSRLWWLGKIAYDADPDNPRNFLTILLHRQDVRSALIERPSVSMNRRVLRGIYKVMDSHWNDGRALFKRETFRRWMIALNRRGGVVLLDALSNESLTKLLQKEAKDALSEGS